MPANLASCCSLHTVLVRIHNHQRHSHQASYNHLLKAFIAGVFFTSAVFFLDRVRNQKHPPTQYEDCDSVNVLTKASFPIKCSHFLYLSHYTAAYQHIFYALDLQLLFTYQQPKRLSPFLTDDGCKIAAKPVKIQRRSLKQQVFGFEIKFLK